MSMWSRVWATNYYPPITALYNVTSPDQLSSTIPTIFWNTPIHAVSLYDAVGYWIDVLRRRLGAKAITTNPSDATFTILLQRGTRTDSTTWRWYNNQGRFPVYVTYATPHDTGSSTQFFDMGQLLDFLVEKFA